MFLDGFGECSSVGGGGGGKPRPPRSGFASYCFLIGLVLVASCVVSEASAQLGVINLSLNPSSVAENSGSTTVTVTATIAPGSNRFFVPLNVTVTVAGGTATAGTDFDTIDDFTVTIPRLGRVGTASFNLVVTDNTIAGGDKTVTFSGSSAAATEFTFNSATLTIIDNEVAPTGITLALSPASVTEGSGTTSVAVTASLFPADSTPLATATEVTVTVAGDTAIEGTDFTAVSAITVTILANMASGMATFDLVVTDDTMGEEDKTLTVSGMATGLLIPDATLTITDDDATGIALSLDPTSVSEGSGTTTVMVTASLLPEGSMVATATAVSVTVAGGTATAAGTDFADVAGFTVTIPANMASGMATFDLVVTDDMLSEGDEDPDGFRYGDRAYRCVGDADDHR